MNKIKLIVNADDFARSPGVNRGILEAHKRGIVSTTTAMMNIEGAAQALREAYTLSPNLGFGVHLNITFGKPISPSTEVASLLGSSGSFRDFRELMTAQDDLNLIEVEREWRIQIERFLETGIALDHLDSHHHSAFFSKALLNLFLDLALEYDCGVRNPYPKDFEYADLQALYPERIIQFIQEQVRALLEAKSVAHPDFFLASFFAKRATKAHLIKLLQELTTGTYELMCHPGFVSPELAEGSNYGRFREQELEVLTDPTFETLLKEQNIELHTFRTAWSL
jgi:predicted glycoside hydrolase/deacetylase ChbG (UPF0249 family)